MKNENYQHPMVTLDHNQELQCPVCANGVTSNSHMHQLGYNINDKEGITIIFKCENCQEEPELQISNYKGRTALGWR